ncbi:MAG: hypothetical protein H0T63_01245 [Pyrinomonadaceae bacterium]|nr:hypothetical protein [Pyrinomonadaceae bacterium]
MPVVLVLLSLILCAPAFGQEPSKRGTKSGVLPPLVERTQVLELPKPRFNRPKLMLQCALKLAEEYVKKEKIDLSSYYLREVRLIQYGGTNDVKEPRWFLWWVNINGALGDYVELTVSMEGKVTQHPSM